MNMLLQSDFQLIQIQKNTKFIFIIMEPSTNDQKQLTKYTIIPIEDPQHRYKLQKYMQERGVITKKTSLCRFYLRGICIMKPQYCKFAHSVYDSLQIRTQPQRFYQMTKQQRKVDFAKKRQFNQTALFILKHVPYKVLYDYQFSQRFKKSNIPVHTLQQIGKERSIRIRIRQIMHRENWDGVIDFLQNNFRSDYPISFLSHWYAKFGFDKPQTRCKFGDFLKYLINVKKYYQVQIILPPSAEYSIVLINSNKKQTHLQQNAELIYQLSAKRRQEENKEKIQEIQKKQIPQEIYKKYMCRYYMAGNCPKSEEECHYAHSIEEIEVKYQLGQQFPKCYRQVIMPLQIRLNYLSLSKFTETIPEYKQYSLEDINLNTNIRNQLREKCHFRLFCDFMKLLERKLPKNHILTIQQLKVYYQGTGFNHTNQNKFQHLENVLWKLGYFINQTHIKDPQTLQKKKVGHVLKLPPIAELQIFYKDKIYNCLMKELQRIDQQDQVLESVVRRTIYSENKEYQIPLHVFLRAKQKTFQQITEQFFPENLHRRVFFETGQQNYKKLTQLVKKFLKKNKKYIFAVDDIEYYIKDQNKESININHFVNMRQMIQQIALEAGRKIYFWPFDNNAFVVDKSNYNVHKKLVQSRKILVQEQIKKQVIAEIDLLQQYKDRVIVVQNQQSLRKAERYLLQCGILGVDIEGRLSKNGYIDLVQISGIKRNQHNKIIHKQIFIFDIWLLKKQNEQKDQLNLHDKVVELLKYLFENPNKIKVLHDCRQDSTALYHILGIKIQSVFDTSGYDVYLAQKSIYAEKQKVKSLQTLKRIYDVKVPGLNTILDKYNAPNGINIFKQSMKKKFANSNSRPYFQQRPIDLEFLEYSARDVQDLVEVYEQMIQHDTQLLSLFIGALYAKCD